MFTSGPRSARRLDQNGTTVGPVIGSDRERRATARTDRERATLHDAEAERRVVVGRTRHIRETRVRERRRCRPRTTEPIATDLGSVRVGGGFVDRSLVVENHAVDALGDFGVEDAALDVGADLDRIAIERITESAAGRAAELEDVVGSELDAGCVRWALLRVTPSPRWTMNSVHAPGVPPPPPSNGSHRRMPSIAPVSLSVPCGWNPIMLPPPARCSPAPYSPAASASP